MVNKMLQLSGAYDNFVRCELTRIDERTISYASRARTFNIVDAIVGALVRPVVTMQKIAAAPPWGIALGILITLAVLGLLVGLTVPTQPGTMMPDTEGMPSSVGPMMAMSQSRIPVIITSVVSPLLQIAYAGILYVLARILGGEGHFRALFSTLVFAGLPGVITLILTLIGNARGSSRFHLLLEWCRSVSPSGHWYCR